MEDARSPRPGAAATSSSTVIASGPLRLVTLQEPQENFHKDEGGKANQLMFRIILQGELTQDVLAASLHTDGDGGSGLLALSVRAIFDDGEFADPSVLEVVGGTEAPHPSIQLSTRLGGVRYRLRTVSKRLGNRGIGVIVDVVGCTHVIAPLRSETTMVFSKRKNKEQRLEEQARERHELMERQRAAASLLNTRSVGSSSSTGNVLHQLQPASSSSSMLVPTQSATDPSQYMVRLPVGTSSTTSTAQLRRMSSATADSDSDESGDDGNSPESAAAAVPVLAPAPAVAPGGRRRSNSTGSAASATSNTSSSSSSKRRKKLTVSTTAVAVAAAAPPAAAASCATPTSQRMMEDRMRELEEAHEMLKHEVDCLRGSIHLHNLQNSRSSSIGVTAAAAATAGIINNNNNSSQTVSWEFVDPGDRPSTLHHHHHHHHAHSVSSTSLNGAGITSSNGVGLLMATSPPPSRTPLGELETSWGQPPVLRRDLSFGTTSNSTTTNTTTGEGGMLNGGT